mmetsp:Transcript_36904/g.83962  ORF Transcript_36904/g.83962 Transcript_36904/m.83962 type:complete len:224 (-) Transcript_36904:262-933(-)
MVHSLVVGCWWWVCLTLVVAVLAGAPGALRSGAAARMLHSKAEHVIANIVLLGLIDPFNAWLCAATLSRGTRVPWRMIFINRLLAAAVWFAMLQDVNTATLDDSMVQAVALWAVGGVSFHVFQVVDLSVEMPEWLRRGVDDLVLAAECFAHLPAFLVVWGSHGDSPGTGLKVSAGWQERTAQVLLYCYPLIALLSAILGIRSRFSGRASRGELSKDARKGKRQ